MSTFQKITIVSLRLSLGWMFLYSGATKVLNPEWSALGYLSAAKTLGDFYGWLAQPNALPFVDGLNAWGQLIIGLALIGGIFVTLASISGGLMMLLYYLPVLNFPYPNSHAFLVDEHVIYAAALLVLVAFKAGQVWGLEVWCRRLPICARFPKLRRLLG